MPEAMSPEWQALLKEPLAAFKGPTPAVVDDLTPAFVDAALRRVLGEWLPTVTHIDVRRLSKQGMASEVAQVMLTYDCEGSRDGSGGNGVNAPVRLIAKGMIPGSEALLAMGFAAERAFYTEVPSTHWAARPAVYFCEGSMILMEKLPGTALDVMHNLPEPYLHHVLRTLANLHAKAWRHAPVGSPDASEAPFGASLMPRRSLKPMLPMFVNGTIGSLDAVRTVFCDTARSVHRDAIAQVDFTSRLSGMFEQLWYPADCPDTLVLGDIKQDNMFITKRADEARPDAAEVTFVDFQGVGWGPAVADVFFLCMLSQDEQAFAAKWEGWLRLWFDALCAAGVAASAYTWEACRRHYRGSATSLLISCCILAKKFQDQRNSPPRSDTNSGSSSSDDAVDAQRQQQQQQTDEKRLACMLFRKWAAAMINLDIISDVLALPPDAPAASA